jgi:hypothetical protein
MPYHAAETNRLASSSAQLIGSIEAKHDLHLYLQRAKMSIEPRVCRRVHRHAAR